MPADSSAPLSPRPDPILDLARDWNPPEVADRLAWRHDGEFNDDESYPGFLSRWAFDEQDDPLDALDRELRRESFLQD